MSERRLAVITPMKPLHLAKQRLQPALSDGERMALAQEMFEHVLGVVDASGIASLKGVVSSDKRIQTLAHVYGFVALPEIGSGYNEAVEQGIGWAQAQGAGDVLILPGDLPSLSIDDLVALVRLSDGATSAAIVVPDAHETGTNALLLRPPGLFQPCFGPDSFRRHCALARAAGVTPTIYRSPTLAHDIDLPADLRIWIET